MKTTSSMSFSMVPPETRSQIKRAGETLISSSTTSSDYLDALDLTNRWRACHAYPINTFQSTLRRKLMRGNYSVYGVAQRLKRLPTIIDKLRRLPTMQLDRMQDIGGIRAILNTIDDVHRLANEYRSNPYFNRMINNEKNYILIPRDSDGYRGIHLIFKTQGCRDGSYNGLRIEMQIRTKLQHLWATAIETIDIALGERLKFKEGDPDWTDFFVLVSSAFAHIEKCPPVPRFSDLNLTDTIDKIREIEKKLGALYCMLGINTAFDHINKKNSGSSHYLLTLDYRKRKVSIKSYNRDQMKNAIDDYSRIEAKNETSADFYSVLVSSDSIATIKRAYPNFFLDIGEFASFIATMIGI